MSNNHKNLTMKTLAQLVLIAGLIFSFSCQNEEEEPQPTEFGYLSMQISLNITSESASGRTEAVNTDDFRVTIFDASGTEIMVFDPFSSAPAEVALPTGEYYVEAHSNNLVDAAFENPYYFGRSANFTIDKEESTAIDINVELANTKVAILYSDDVVNTFDSYTGTVTVSATGASLFYAQGETREGYFVTSPLAVQVDLSYTKLDGTTIDRTFNATIDDPQPKTLYNINVDAALEDGTIVFNITVDESFDVVDISLGDLVVVDGCLLTQYVVFEDTDIETWDFSYSGATPTTIDYSDNYGGGTYTYALTFDGSGNLTFGSGTGNFTKDEEFTYDPITRTLERKEYRDFGSGLELYRVKNFIYNVVDQIIQIEEYDVVNGANVLNELTQYYYPDNNSKNPNYAERHNGLGNVINVEYWTYDNAPNPIYEAGIWACDDCIDFEFIAFSENNITSYTRYNADETVVDSEVTAAYQYNAENYPTRVDYLYGNGESFHQEYDYQCN